MTKAYSNKALPMGTVLREWRIEEVLGVGGFGIVYKARGVYFNELVAIKEYFPSSISERDSEDTVVPIDFRGGGGARARPQEVRRGSQALVEPVDAHAVTPTSSASEASSRSTAPPTW